MNLYKMSGLVVLVIEFERKGLVLIIIWTGREWSCYLTVRYNLRLVGLLDERGSLRVGME